MVELGSLQTARPCLGRDGLHRLSCMNQSVAVSIGRGQLNVETYN